MLLGRWELGQGKRKCSPPKACSVMLRHRDSRLGLISRSGPGTGQSGGNMRMAWGDEWTGSEWVRCTELRLWLGILLLPPGLANHKFCRP